MIEIPYGYCQCGCGGRTNLANVTERKRGRVKGEPYRFLHGHNLQMGKDNPCWKGGRIIDPNGYVRILMPTYPRADSKGYVMEHIYRAEKAIGHRLPPGAQVHHHSSTQLVICQGQAYHRLLHQRTRAFRACGNASWRKCWVCKQYDSPDNLHIKGTDCYHPACKTEHGRKNNWWRKAPHELGAWKEAK